MFLIFSLKFQMLILNKYMCLIFLFKLEILIYNNVYFKNRVEIFNKRQPCFLFFGSYSQRNIERMYSLKCSHLFVNCRGISSKFGHLTRYFDIWPKEVFALYYFQCLTFVNIFPFVPYFLFNEKISSVSLGINCAYVPFIITGHRKTD